MQTRCGDGTNTTAPVHRCKEDPARRITLELKERNGMEGRNIRRDYKHIIVISCKTQDYMSDDYDLKGKGNQALWMSMMRLLFSTPPTPSHPQRNRKNFCDMGATNVLARLSRLLLHIHAKLLHGLHDT